MNDCGKASNHGNIYLISGQGIRCKGNSISHGISIYNGINDVVIEGNNIINVADYKGGVAFDDYNTNTTLYKITHNNFINSPSNVNDCGIVFYTNSKILYIPKFIYDNHFHGFFLII